MLVAIQRPSMGSSKNNQDMPFGYDFGSSDHSYPLDPPEPPPGLPILTQGDKGLLDHFLDGVGSNDFGGHIFPDSFEEGMDGMGFWSEPAPLFMGTTTSYGQQPQFMTNEMQSLAYPEPNDHTAHLNHHLTQSASADVLAGAAALLQQNGHAQRPYSTNNTLYPSASNMLQSRAQPLQNMMPFSTHNDSLHDPFFTNLMYGSQHNDVFRKPPAKNIDMHWGSDTGFGSGQGFVAPKHQEDRETMERKQMDVLNCFEPHGPSTAASTQPSSPLVSRAQEYQARKSEKLPEHEDDSNEPDGTQAKKRRKSEVKKVEVEVVLESEISSKTVKKRRPKSVGALVTATAASQSSPPPPSKRRKSTASSHNKITRENLTEDQKRENHIRSEQKRRTLIKEGFDDLGELVPDLRSGGFSKSAVLSMAADFLDDLIMGNKTLRTRLAALEDGN